MRSAVATLLFLAMAAPAHGAALRLERVGTFREPVYVTGVPGSPRTVAVVERGGRIRLVRRGHVRRRALADIRDRVVIADPDETRDQRGLFSVAFPRDYHRSGRFYVDYVDHHGRLRVDELRRGRRGVRHVLDLGAVTTMHHGGQVQFGRDGRLYVSTGMDDDPQVSQDASRAGGKILRVNPRLAHPAAEVYALGLRNPWRFSFDRVSGLLLIGDVGDEASEEVDVLPNGAAPGTNFGWPAVEGDVSSSGTAVGPIAPPALVHHHGDDWCAITGGYVVRDKALRRLYGRYLYGDLCSGRLWSARVEGAALRDDRPVGAVVPYVVSFGEDDRGRLYGVSFFGDVFRLTPP